MKKFISFLVLCLSFMGAIGGIGYTIYDGAYPIAVGVAALTYLAWPQIKKYFTNLML